MKQRIDLGELSLEKDGDKLTIIHHKTKTRTSITADSLARWLLRKLRELF